MEELIDIEGLTQIGNWPLAVGWWVIIVALIISAVFIVALWLQKQHYRASWQYKSHSRLHRMQLQLDHTDPKVVLRNFSLELRKIAMLATKREACASLTGKPWLEWLQQHDPRGFNWVDNGAILLVEQYKPEAQIDIQMQLIQLIAAAKKWVYKC